MLSKKIGQNDLVESYEALLGLGMIMVVNVLKWDSQWPNLIQALAMSISLLMHSLFLTIFLRCLQDNLFGPGAKKLLYLLMASIVSAVKKGGYLVTSLSGILSKRSESICQFCTELNKLWSTSQSFSSLIHGWPLYWIASIMGSFFFLTQFISSYGPHFLLTISSIFSSKKLHFIFLTIPLNLF